MHVLSREAAHLREKVEDLKRRLCYNSTIPFWALQDIILYEDSELHDQLHRYHASTLASEDGWEEQGKREFMEEWLNPKAPRMRKRKHKKRSSQGSPNQDSSLHPAKWNTENIFNALEEHQDEEADAVDAPDLHEVEDAIDEETEKFVPSAVSQAGLEASAHLGNSGTNIS